ncbi:hypothetical protein K440DRAFT_654688 [Wilcoxina mikolae CBS 423.85]|nr:hypothetical protein K440DRAFT_654688 [Wilcoxina mikolae CBS 423.85]
MRALLLAATLYITFVLALGRKPIVSSSKEKGALALFENGKAIAGIRVAGNAPDYPGVICAAHDLSADFGRVTGQNLTISITTSTTKAVNMKTAIIIGTIGKSALIDFLVSSKKLDVSKIKGKWESFQTQLVKNPVAGMSQALVIAGSDKRGTIFGIYEVSEQIGSPKVWYYWADVAPRKHSSIYALNTQLIREEPSIKYRGFFLDGEQPALSGWVKENFPRGEYGPSYHHEFYSRVFELLLRLKANFLWPTMWDSMFAVDNVKNQETAGLYGIVMSTSYTEPLQMSTKEWNTLGNGTWDYTLNADAIYKYWEKGVKRAKDYENMWTIGMRRNGDNNLGETVVTELLARVVGDQREILSNVLGRMSLLWTDDNWGNVRRLPLANETNPAGMYYHFDCKLASVPIFWPLLTSLLHLTYQRNARQIWVVNVGDLKPLELPIDYYLNLAYDFDAWGGIDKVVDYERAWAAREFGEDVAEEIAEIVELYEFYAARRKYELVDPKTYSVIHYSEAETVLEQWKNLTPAAYIDHDIHISTAKNNLYANQRCNSANAITSHTQLIETSLAGAMGVAVESSNGTVPGDDFYNSAQYNNTLVHPQLDPYAPVPYRTTGIFSRGTEAFAFNVTPHNSWVHVSPSKGSSTPKTPPPTFIKSNKHVSIEASHSSRNSTNGNVRYSTLRHLGRSGDAVTLFPVTASSQDTSSGPPLNNNGPGRPLKYAIALDDEEPQTVRYIPELANPLAMPKGWEQAVADGNVWKSVTKHMVLAVGKKTLKVWALEPSVVLQKVVVDLGGVKDSYLGPPESVRV